MMSHIFRLLKSIVPLTDAWVEYTGDLWGGETNETPDNSFKTTGTKSKRIDYIMYLSLIHI